MKHLYILLIFVSACQSLPDNQAEKFRLINETLNQNLEKAKEVSFFALKSYYRFVEYEGDPAIVKANTAIMQNLAKKVYLLLAEIEQIKNQIKNKTDSEAEKLMLGEQKNGLAYSLEKQLDGFWQDLKKEHSSINLDTALFLPLTQDKYLLKSSPSPKRDFAQANFQDTHVGAILATLIQKQGQIVAYQQEIMKKYGVGEISYLHSSKNRWQVWAQPQKSVFKAGDEYQAQMFFARESYLIPAKQLIIDGNKSSESTIQLGIYEKLLDKAGEQNLEIRYKTNHRGKDTTLMLNYPYYVFASPKNR